MTQTQKPVCVIVGAGPGNGAGLARKFSAAGFAVALLARNSESLAALVASLPDSQAIACDVTDPAAVTAAFSAIEATMGIPDTLIYNAGKGAWGDALSISPADFEAAWRVNSYGALLVAQRVLPAMLKAGRGNFIFIGATATRRGGPQTAAFAPAKAAQRSLAESLARAYGPRGVHVALIVIDAVVDEPVNRAAFSDRPESFFCKPSDIAETAYQLSQQGPSAWTFELEVRPFGERW